MAHVLVVDDMLEMRTLLRTIVESLGHEVSEAGNGVEAMELLARAAVDLVVTDGLMPEMDGFRLALEIRRDPALASLPIVFHTASFAAEEDQRLASELGADAYLIKPAATDLIIEAVQTALARDVNVQTPTIGEEALAALLGHYSERLESKLDHKVEQLTEARDARDSFRSVFDSLPLVVVTFDADGRIDHYNRTALEFAGAEAEGSPPDFLAVVSAEDSSRFLDAARTALADGDSVEVMLRVRRHDGRSRDLRFSVLPYHDQDGASLGVVAAGVDVTEEEERTDLLRYLAEHDVLTDLPNRRVLDARFEALLAQVGSGKTCALLFIDIDRFKTVNSDYGHDVGDAALANLARLLVSCVEPGDLVVRLCGDEFVVLAEDIGWDEAEALSERIRSRIAEASLVPGAADRRMTVSIGFNVVPDATTPADALRESDRALYQAKNAGRDRAAKGAGAPERAAAEAAGSFEHPVTTLGFTPVYALASGALSRCSVRAAYEFSGGRFTDEEYMDEATRRGSARHAARRTIKALLDVMSGHDVSCSARLWLCDLLDPTVFDRVEDAADRRAIDPKRLGLEVTVAHMLGSGPPQTWFRAASRSRLRLILDAAAADLRHLADLPLEHFGEMVFPFQAVQDGTEESRHERTSALRTVAAAGLKLTAAGIDTSEALASAIEWGADRATGPLLGGTAADLGEIPPHFDAE